MRVLTSVYGSHLFGCPVSTSDEDYKQIHLESLYDLLFQDTHAVQSKDESGPCKVEGEDYSLRFFLYKLGKGNVIATDMFFSPPKFWKEHDPLWLEVLKLKPHIITSNIRPFAGYARDQSHKYGNKGKKLLTVQKALKLLEGHASFDTLCIELKGMEGIRYTTEHAAGGDIRHIDICGKQFGETTDYSLWMAPIKALEENYGERARLSTSGLDLKAQYHTVRICCEAIELVTTGHITFPRPEAPLLLKIRMGELGEDALRDLVDTKLAELSALPPAQLPTEPNEEVIRDFIYSAHRDFIQK